LRILVTNDDGIHAPGLQSAVRIAQALGGEVWVVAPETDQSGLAHSLTLSHPLRVREVAERQFALTGTPTDCVIMGVRELMPEPPSLILSGVNSGQNIADDVTYSGTVAGAIEGALLGIRSIALSQAYAWEDGARAVPWETCEAHGPRVVEQLIQSDFPSKVLVNVNFPNCGKDDVKGTSCVRQGAFNHGLYAEKRHDGRGFPYYWLKFGREVADTREGSDVMALRAGHIAVTPLKLDLTDYAFMDRLEDRLATE